MEAFIDLLLTDNVLFLIAITIIVLIILIICCLVLLKKKYEMGDTKYHHNMGYENSISKLNSLVSDEMNTTNDVKTEVSGAMHVETTNTKIDNNKMDLESMLSKMEESLNEKENAIANFEQEQEEKAIISYEELKKAVSQNNNTNVTKVESLEPNVSNISEIKEQPKFVNDSKNFKNTDFISPIYGKMDNNYEYPTISGIEEETKVETKEVVFAKHSKDNNELFLDSLKQFRKNLE